MEDTIMTAVTEATTPPDTTVTTDGDTPPDTGTSGTATLREDTTPEDTPVPHAPNPVPATLPVRFRHQQRELTMGEAVDYAQKGLKYESLQPTMDKLRMMAAGRGQSLEDFVDSWANAEEQVTMESLLKKTGGDREAAQRLLQLEQENRRRLCHLEPAQQEQRALNARLAGEFGELRQAFPSLRDFDDLPDEVLRDAIESERPLLDAYLRHQHSESQRIQENRAWQASAAQASAGSQADQPPIAMQDAVTEAMLNGIRSVFQ